METKYWAVGMGNYVEVRTHPTIPKRRASVMVIPDKSRRGPVSTEYVIFLGGKVIKAFKSRTFTIKTRLPVAYGEVKQIPPECVVKLLGKEKQDGR